MDMLLNTVTAAKGTITQATLDAVTGNRKHLAQEARKIARGSWLSRTAWFQEKPLSRLVEQHIAGRADNSRVLWQMLMLEKALSRIDLR